MTLPLKCKCIENGVEKKTATLATAVTGIEDSTRAAKTACGWE